MNLEEKIVIGCAYFKAIFLKEKKPFFVSWGLTRRCNLRCKYCNAWREAPPEMDTSQILDIIDRLSELGTRMIRFTGGEPLLRDDIGEIICYARNSGIFVTLATNGIMLANRISQIKKIDGISISLDGTEDVHDAIRGLGTYKSAIEALSIAKSKNIPLTLVTTLNSINLFSVDHLLHIAEMNKVRIFFQPATKMILYDEQPNPVYPDADQFRAVILSLIKLKRKNKFIGNSISGLRHLYHWPEKTAINCMAGRIICRLHVDGNISSCPRFRIKDNELNIIEKDIAHCFNKLYPPYCQDCWCSFFVELNLISEFNISAIINAI